MGKGNGFGKRIKISVAVFSLFLLACLIYSIPMIYRNISRPVESFCTESSLEFEAVDCVESLIRLLDSDRVGFERKNRAVWVLGQLADERSIPSLLQLQTGNACPKPCTKDGYICQYELEKAISSSRRGRLFSWFIRRNLLDQGPAFSQ